MSFVSFTVAAKGPAGSGFGASLMKVRGGPARLAFFLRPPVAAELGWAAGDRLDVLLGTDEQHGLVRLRKSEAGTARIDLRQATRGGGAVLPGAARPGAAIRRPRRTEEVVQLRAHRGRMGGDRAAVLG